MFSLSAFNADLWTEVLKHVDVASRTRLRQINKQFYKFIFGSGDVEWRNRVRSILPANNQPLTPEKLQQLHHFEKFQKEANLKRVSYFDLTQNFTDVSPDGLDVTNLKWHGEAKCLVFSTVAEDTIQLSLIDIEVGNIVARDTFEDFRAYLIDTSRKEIIIWFGKKIIVWNKQGETVFCINQGKYKPIGFVYSLGFNNTYMNILPDSIELFGVTKEEGFVLVKRIMTKCDNKPVELANRDSDSDNDMEYHFDCVDHYLYNCFQLSAQHHRIKVQEINLQTHGIREFELHTTRALSCTQVFKKDEQKYLLLSKGLLYNITTQPSLCFSIEVGMSFVSEDFCYYVECIPAEKSKDTSAKVYDLTSGELLSHIPSLDLHGVKGHCWLGSSLFLHNNARLQDYHAPSTTNISTLHSDTRQMWSQMSHYPESNIISLLQVNHRRKPCGILTMFV